MIPPEHDDDDPDTTTRPRNTDKPVREAEWTIIEKPSHEWEKIEVPRPEVIDTDEELRRLVGKDSIWAFVRVSALS